MSADDERRARDVGDLFPLVYEELRQRARHYLSSERRDHTFQPTALVHEAWLRVQQQHRVAWQGRTHARAWLKRELSVVR